MITTTTKHNHTRYHLKSNVIFSANIKTHTNDEGRLIIDIHVCKYVLLEFYQIKMKYFAVNIDLTNYQNSIIFHIAGKYLSNALVKNNIGNDGKWIELSKTVDHVLLNHEFCYKKGQCVPTDRVKERISINTKKLLGHLENLYQTYNKLILNIAKVHQMVLENCRIKVREITEIMNISKKRIKIQASESCPRVGCRVC